MPKKRGKRACPIKVNKRLLVVCEGEKTEFNYFDGFIRKCKLRGQLVEVKVIDVRMNTAKELIGFLRNLREEPSDELWAVFDKDGYTKHPDAFNMAKANNIRIAFSSISFEYWVLLHFEYTTRPFERAEEIISHLKNKDYIDYEKNDRTTYEKIKDKTTVAVTHAVRVRKYQHEANPNSKIYEMNPYTNVDELLVSIKKIGEI